MLKIFEIELESQQLTKIINNTATPGYKIILITNYFLKLLKENEPKKYYPYIIPNIKIYFELIEKSGQLYFNPEIFEKIEYVFLFLRESGLYNNIERKIAEIESKIISCKKNVLNILDGKEIICGSELSKNSVPIVLIEKPGIHNNNIEYGEIHKLNLEASQRVKGEKVDNVEFKNGFESGNTEIIEYLDDITNLTREHTLSQGINTKNYNYSFYFDKEDHWYCGKSLGLGAMCLTYNSILVSELAKIYYKFRDGCVFSGEIDSSGNLEKLDSESLKTKINIVFFSSYQKFVLPEDNLQEAKAELSKLNEKYPNRKLQLIPCKSFESVFKNLEIVEQFELKFHEKLKANYHKYHRAANWVFTFIIFSIVVYFAIVYLLPQLDRNPVRGEFKDSKYFAYNKYGVKVWENIEPEIKYYNKRAFTDYAFNLLIAVTDIDNDGENEIIYINNWGLSKHGGTDLIICCNSSNDIKWKYQIERKDFSYDWESDSLMGDWMFMQLIVDDMNNDGKKEIVANAYFCPFFPDRLIAEYWHSGYFNYIASMDVDGDGKKEIIASGINNYPGYRCGCLIVLDPNKMQGASFKTDPLKTGVKGTEKYYMLFPKTFMTKYNVSNFNTASYIAESGKNVRITVLDGPDVDEQRKIAHLVYQLDKNMNVTNITTSNQFIETYGELLSNGKIQPVPNIKDYLDSLKTRVRWWNGEDFEFKSVMNKNYWESFSGK